MHSFQLITALGALFAAVAAVPVKRDTVVSTVTEIDVITEYATETVWVDATGSPSTVQAVPTTSATTTSTYVAPVAPATTAQATTQATTQAQVTVQPAATTPSTTSTYVAPPATSTTSSTLSTDTTPVTTAAPTSTTAAAPAAAATSSISSSSNAVGTTYTGDITYYDVGLGSCGYTNTDSEMVLAMAHGMMDKSTMCGSTVTISYGGQTHTAKIVDTCMGCANGALDLSPALFAAVAPSGNGRVSGVEWWFN